MSGIQSFKYKRRKITVVFWNNNVWFKAKEIREILGYKESLTRFTGLLWDEENKLFKPKANLITEKGLYVLTYHKGLKPKAREKAQELYDFVQEEVMPVFEAYIRSWL